jgi:penicillin-binding protein 1A
MEPTSPPVPSRAHAFVRQLADLWRQFPRPLKAGLLVAAVAPIFLYIGWSRCGFMGCPDVGRLKSYRPGGAPVLLDRTGNVLADLAPVEGERVSLKSLPKHVPDAFVAVEDKRFREHGAMDVRRIFGAMLANLRSWRMEQGFSTITMQLARNVFPDQLPGGRRTLLRKLLEVRVAQEIEDAYSKDEILEMYLNHIYFGHGARGIEAASQHYFDRPAAALTVAQAALLAALPKAPSHYDPLRHPARARERRDLVLALMQQQGRLPPAQAQVARREQLSVVPRTRPLRSEPRLAAWFVDEVRRELEATLGADFYEPKLRIHTTLDSGLQRVAEEELRRQLEAIERNELGRFDGPRYATDQAADQEETPYLQGAVVALNVETGDVLAWVGGRDHAHSGFDRVKAARRQAGSAFKPFVYATALSAGRMLSQTVIDAPLSVPIDHEPAWEPKNYDRAFDGLVTLRDALVRSKNIPTVRLAKDVGYDRVAELAERAGLEKPVPRQPSMALGTVTVSPLELAAAYTVFAGLGDGVRPRMVLKVERGNGEVVWHAPLPERRRVIPPGVAYLVTDTLRDALWRGTGSTVWQTGFHAPSAGKTGTTNDETDAWFVGYTPKTLAAVWIGFDRQRRIMARATGGRLAAPVWGRIMKRRYGGRPSIADWPPPPDVVQGWTDPATGKLLAPGCRPWEGEARRELFVRAAVPSSICPSSGEPPIFEGFPAELRDEEEGMELELPEDPEEGVASKARFYVPATPPPLPPPRDEPRPEPTPPWWRR